MSQQHHVQMKKQQRVMENRLDKVYIKKCIYRIFVYVSLLGAGQV